MYCPNCKAEYREGFTVCRDCNVNLMEELPPAPEEKPSRSSLFAKNSGIERWLKIGGLVYIALGVIYEISRMIRFGSSMPPSIPAFSFIVESFFSIFAKVIWGLFYYGLGRIIEILREGFAHEKQ